MRLFNHKIGMRVSFFCKFIINLFIISTPSVSFGLTYQIEAGGKVSYNIAAADAAQVRGYLQTPFVPSFKGPNGTSHSFAGCFSTNSDAPVPNSTCTASVGKWRMSSSSIKINNPNQTIIPAGVLYYEDNGVYAYINSNLNLGVVISAVTSFAVQQEDYVNHCKGHKQALGGTVNMSGQTSGNLSMVGFFPTFKATVLNIPYKKTYEKGAWALCNISATDWRNFMGSSFKSEVIILVDNTASSGQRNIPPLFFKYGGQSLKIADTTTVTVEQLCTVSSGKTENIAFGSLNIGSGKLASKNYTPTVNCGSSKVVNVSMKLSATSGSSLSSDAIYLKMLSTKDSKVQGNIGISLDKDQNVCTSSSLAAKWNTAIDLKSTSNIWSRPIYFVLCGVENAPVGDGNATGIITYTWK